MEHFETPEGAPPIDIPYVGTEFYDGGDFSTYPERKGWKMKDKFWVLFDDKNPEEVEAFFQTWIYFGFLISVFRIVGIEVASDEFIQETEEGRRIITTKKLPELIQQWIGREGFTVSESNTVVAASDPQPADRSKDARGKAVMDILLTVLRFVDTYCNEKARVVAAGSGNLPLFWPISPEIATSIMAVGEPINQVAIRIYTGIVGLEKWGISPLLSRRLKEAGWCNRDIPLSEHNIALNYFFGGYPSPRAQLNHEACTKIVCHSAVVNVDVDNYEPKHVFDGCDCLHVVAPDVIDHIVLGGGIPILCWRKGELTVTAYDDTQKTPYAAISHVWSDGMGNDGVRNSLPRCQLERIQTLVDKLYAEKHALPQPLVFPILAPQSTWSSFSSAMKEAHVGFWLDTLCVPVGDGKKDLRNTAIRQMGKIYSAADRVLILDSFIQDLPCAADITDKFARLILSNWHRRLWTLQEAQLGKLLFFQFKDGAQSIPDICLTDDDATPSLREAYSVLRTSCLVPFVMFYEMLHWMQGDRSPSTIIANFIPLSHNVRSRATSKSDDEPLCLATILGLDPLPLLNLKGSVRMERFYELVGHYEPRIIFHNYPRLQNDGFRWAPRSFLGQSFELFTSPPEHDSSRATLYPDGGGLKLTFSGIMLETMHPHFGAKIGVLCREQRQKNWYELYLLPDEHGGYPTWDPANQYVVIYSRPRMEISTRSVKAISEAIVGIYVYKKQGRIRMRYLSRARVEFRLNQEELEPVRGRMSRYLEGQESNVDGLYGWFPVRGNLFDDDQKWSVL